jgi:hypothetical protein
MTRSNVVPVPLIFSTQVGQYVRIDLELEDGELTRTRWKNRLSAGSVEGSHPRGARKSIPDESLRASSVGEWGRDTRCAGGGRKSALGRSGSMELAKHCRADDGSHDGIGGDDWDGGTGGGTEVDDEVSRRYGAERTSGHL